MPRQARIQSPTNYYHVMIRGNNREPIFNGDKEKKYFLDVLQDQNEDNMVDIAAYCLMNNHVHIIIKADLINLTNAIKSVNTTYAMHFNRMRDRVGHVFQDRYKSRTINDENHLLRVIRYVHNNPVKAKIVKLPDEYMWSSYNEYNKKSSYILGNQRAFIMGFFNNSLERFAEFHRQSDDNEYLEIEEDIEKERFEQAQKIISEYFSSKGLVDAKQVARNSVYMEEIIENLLKKSRLTHRQIAGLLQVSNSTVHNLSVNRK